MIHCNDCGHNGPPKTNSRHETRCEACYSVNVAPIGETIPAALTPAEASATAGDTPPEVEIKPRPRKRTTGG